jgi:hypothetical protein
MCANVERLLANGEQAPSTKSRVREASVVLSVCNRSTACEQMLCALLAHGVQRALADGDLRWQVLANAPFLCADVQLLLADVGK